MILWLVTSAATAQVPIPGWPQTGTLVPYATWVVPSDGSAAYPGTPVDALDVSAYDTVSNLLNCCGTATSVLENEYWDIVVCPLVAMSPKTFTAIARLQDLGLPVNYTVGGVLQCHYPVEDPDTPWGLWLQRPGEGPQGAYAPDPWNQVAMVHANDDRFTRLVEKLDGTRSVATTDLFGVLYVNEDGEPIEFVGNWDVIINGRDWNYIHDCPSKATNWHAKIDGVYAYDVVIHELMHAVGIHHFEQTSENEIVSSTQNYAVLGGGHFGLEAFGDPYAPEGPECGDEVIPLVDQQIVEWMWGDLLDVTVNGSGLLHNWEIAPHGANHRMQPIRWGEGLLHLGAYCPGDKLTESAQTAMKNADMGLRYTGTDAVAPVSYFATKQPGWQEGPSSITVLQWENETTYYDILGTGQWYGNNPNTGNHVRLPPGGDPADETSNTGLASTIVPGNDRAVYRMAQVLQAFAVPAVHLPATIELKPQCGPNVAGDCCGE